MSVTFSFWTGHASERLVPLKRCISGFTRQDRQAFKIGISSDPNRRWREEYRGHYDRMLVIYSTSSEKSIRRIEKWLTEYFEDFSDNLRLGGGGPSSSGPYYLYVVLKRSNKYQNDN